MNYKKGMGNFSLPVLGIGTWQIGGRYEKDTSRDAEDIQGIKTAIKMGLTHIDTAELYGAGHTEELVGEAIKDFDRSKLFIASKVNTDHLKYDDVIKACKDSLQRLQTNYIDLYFVHGVSKQKVPIKETMKAMDYLVNNNFIKYIGISNFSVEQLKEAQSYLKNKIVAVQIEYNLMTRERGLWTQNMESEILPYCQKNNILFIAWRPLGKGELSKPGHPIIDEIAKKNNKTQSQVALNWLINKKNVVTIFKATNPKHIKENLGALDWELSPEDEHKLDKLEFVKP